MPEEAWREHRETLVPDHPGADDGMVRGAFQTWLLRSGGRTILIDTGIGNDKTRPAVALWDHLRLDCLGNLARAGVRPEDVDLVVNTHLHPRPHRLEHPPRRQHLGAYRTVLITGLLHRAVGLAVDVRQLARCRCR